MAAPTRRIGLVLYPGVEVLDFAGPYEVFTTASRVAQRRAPGRAAPFEVRLLAGDTAPVAARAGLAVLPEARLADGPALHWLLVPGGVIDAALDDMVLLQGLRDAARGCERVVSVCTGVFLLAAAGLVPDGTAVTTHWEDVDDLRRRWPTLDVQAGRRWVDAGPLTTSAGISAGIDMSLHLVAQAAGAELAEATARQMDYRWQREPA